MARKLDIWDMADEVEPLELDAFWGFIETSRSISTRENLNHHEALAQLLSLRSLPEIASFKARFSMLSRAVMTQKAYAIIGRSDDGFHYGISSLISSGRESYEALANDPKTFRGLISEYEVFEYAAHKAFEEPDRSKLRAQALARHEHEVLGASVADPLVAKPGPRV